MGKHRLEDTFKDKLYNLNTPVDTGEIWAGIQQQNQKTASAVINATSNSNSNTWKWSAFILLSLLLGASFIFNSEIFSSIGDGNTSLFSRKGHQKSPIATEVEIPQEFSSNSTSINGQDANPSNTPKTNRLILEAKSMVEEKSIAKIPTSNASYPANNKSITSKNIGEDPVQKNIRFNATTSSISKQIESKRNDSSLSQVNQNLTKVEAGINNLTKVEAGINDQEITNKNTVGGSGKILNATNNAIKSSPSTKNDSKVNSDIELPSLVIPGMAMLDAPEAVDFLFQRNKTVCYDDWNNKRKKFAIIPYGGVDFVTNKTETSETFISYLEQRRSTMKFLEVLKGGLLFKFNVSPNLYVKVGGAYDQIRERFEHVSIDPMELILPDQVIAIRVTMEGDTIPITGDGAVTIVNTTTWVKHNEYHSFNIPAIVGYESFIGGNFSWYAEAGIFYNLLFRYQGTLLDANNDVVTGENFFLNQTGASLYGALGLNYMLSDNLSATLNASYRRIAKSINNADLNPIDQNLGLVGLTLGLEYRF